MMKIALALAAFVSVASWNASAAQFELGTHMGALGTTGATTQSEIAYGVHFNVNPFGFGAFQADATFASFPGGTYFSTSPAVIFYLANFEEMKLGVLGGAGFYKFATADVKFGFNAGATSEFALSQNLTVGLEARYHPLVDADDLWSVFLTLNYRFEPGNGW